MRYFNRYVAVLCGFCVIAITAGMWGQYRLKTSTAPPVLEWVGPAALAADPVAGVTASPIPVAVSDMPEQPADVLCTCATAPEARLLVDINRANADQLMQLPGIGPAYAERIIAMRTLRGGFVYVEELLEVSGIGPARFAQLEPHVFVGPYEGADE